jgi:hypothetical protein
VGRWWWARLPLLVYMAYVLVRHVSAPYYPPYNCIFKMLDLAIHEAGHVLFKCLGQYMMVAGGSLFQCLVPLLCIFMFLKQRDFFAMVFCLAWFGINLFDVAIYVADAPVHRLPLVSPFGFGEPPLHDWQYLLGRENFGLAMPIANGLRIAGTISMLAFLIPGSWLCWRMFRTRNRPTPDGRARAPR